MSYSKVDSQNLFSTGCLLAATVLLSLVVWYAMELLFEVISQAAHHQSCYVGEELFEGCNINSVDIHANIQRGILLAEGGASVRTKNNRRKRTAGIKAIPYCSQKYGEVVFFDFACQLEYHGPHQIFLESLLAELVMPPSTPSSVTANSGPLPNSIAKLVKLSSTPTTISSPPPTPCGFNTVSLNISRSTVRDVHALLDLSTKPTLQDVNELVVTQVAASWKRLALRLGVEGCVVDIIFKNHPNDCEGACLEMFNRWLRGDRHTGEEERTWSTVLAALGRAGYKELEGSCSD